MSDQDSIPKYIDNSKLFHIADALLSHPLMLALFCMDFAMLVFVRTQFLVYLVCLVILVLISLFFGQKLQLFRCSETKTFTRL